MNVEELKETTEHAHHSGQKMIGLTTAIVAVLLAVTTLLSHRAHTEEILTLTQAADGYSFYQAKHNRAYLYGLAAQTEILLPNGRGMAMENLKNSVDEECGIPAPKDCVSPVLRKSPLFQQLLQQPGNTGGAKPDKESHPEAEHKSAGVEGQPAEKHEKPKESGAKEGAVQINEQAAEKMTEVKVLEKKAGRYDAAELFLEVSIVLCSIALLAEAKLYWQLSFVTTAIGVGVAIWGWFLH